MAVLLEAASWVQSSEENASGRGDFSLGVQMGSVSFPPKLDESINRGVVCTYAFHCTDSKDPDIHVLDR